MLTLIHLPVNFHYVFNGIRKFSQRIDREKRTPICGNFVAGIVRHEIQTK